MNDLTDAYENGAYIPDSATYVPMWETRAAAFRDAMGDRARLDLAYGDGARHRFDLFMPDGDPHGLVVFVHGGYWLKFDHRYWSHLAAGATARGWAVAMPSYDLAPQVRIAEITAQVARAVNCAAEQVAGPLVVTGHSAGGHLSARMRCRDVGLDGETVARMARVLPISPLSDLHPLMRTAMNADLGIDSAEAQAESPALTTDLHDIPTTVWVGSDERPAFLDQARWLTKAWPRTDLHIAEGRHHLDVIAELDQPDSPLTNALLAGF